MADGSCSVQGCEKRDTRGREKMCRMHAERLRRHGDVNINLNQRRPDHRSVRSNGYVSMYAPEHPIAMMSGRPAVWEHRVVLYDTIGLGVHTCHWCGCSLRWQPENDTAKRLTVDHLDGNRTNNDPSNLAPTCGPCNSAHRGREKTQCANGHPFTSDNTIIDDGKRRCRICRLTTRRGQAKRRRARGIGR